MAKQVLRMIFNEIHESIKKTTINTDSAVGQALNRDGIVILQEKLQSNVCEEIKSLINSTAQKSPETLWTDGADTRLFGADRVSLTAKDFFYSPAILKELGWDRNLDKLNGFPMLGRIDAVPNNVGSGGGWHRDSPLVSQFKAIAYLSDVSDAHGPFQYIVGSHKPLQVLADSFEFDFKYSQYRFTSEEIDRVIKKYPQKLKTLTAPAGTILLVNTRGIHRGMPIRNGTRYAITNYYFFDQQPPAHLLEMIKFNPTKIS